MADYGLRVKDADGNTLLSITDRITRLMYKSSQTDSSGNSGSLDIIDGLSTAQFAFLVNAGTTNTTHIVSRSSNTISWTTHSYYTLLTPGTCVMFCFAYT
jgi:hypothetical protein